jgi:hypothetical protein
MLDVAFQRMDGNTIAIVSVIASATAAVLIALINAIWSTNRQERARQRERNQERRAELYVDFLQFMRAAEEGEDPYDHPDEPRLFGSKKVKALLRDYWNDKGETRYESRKRVEEQIAKEMQAE